MNKYFKICALFILLFISTGCSKDDEPGEPENVINEKIENDLKDLLKKIPMNWGASPADIREDMSEPVWKDYKYVFNPYGTVTYKSDLTPYIIMFYFEHSNLISISIAFPRETGFKHQNIFRNYEYLGVSDGSEVYLDKKKSQIGFYKPYAVYNGAGLSTINFATVE